MKGWKVDKTQCVLLLYKEEESVETPTNEQSIT